MTLYVKRYLIVARADVAAAANTAASQADTNDGGDGSKTFTVGLSSTGNAPITHYWCSWALTIAQATAIRTRLRNTGATVAEVTPIAPGATPASTRFAIFDDADGWTPDTVLTACGLQRIGGAL